MAPLPPRDRVCLGGGCTRILPVPFEGIQWHWLVEETSGPAGIVFVGNETTVTPFTPVTGVPTQHWQSPLTCQDMWLAPLPPGAGSGDGSIVLGPVLYSVADSASAPSCGHGNWTYTFSNVAYLNGADHMQEGNPIFAVPLPCMGIVFAGGGGGPRGNGGPATGVPVVWTIAAAALAIAAGVVIGFFLSRRVRKKRGGGATGGIGLGGWGDGSLPNGPQRGGGYSHALLDGL